MITAFRRPAGPTPTAPGGVAPAPPAAPDGETPAPGKDFVSVMTRARHERALAALPANNVKLEPKPSAAASLPPQVESSVIQEFADKGSEATTAAPDSADPKAPTAAVDTPNPQAGADASLASIILGMMAQAGISVAPAAKPVAAQTSSSVGLSPEAGEAKPDGEVDSGALRLSFNARTASELSTSVLVPNLASSAGGGTSKLDDAQSNSCKAMGREAQSPVEAAPVREKLPEGLKLEHSVSMIPAANSGGNTLAALLDSALSAPSVHATSPGESPPVKAHPADLAAQAVVAQLAGGATAGLNSPDSPNGTGGALNEVRMKFVAEKNETAGDTGQKVPRVAAIGGAATGSAGKTAGNITPGPLAQKRDVLDSALAMDFSAKPILPQVEQGATLVAIPPGDQSSTQAARIEHLVNQEVVTIRQSGANSMAVSLKLDANTELFLQLTNHNGQIQASLRCERGSLAGLDSHWGDLQESLARQNVQLLPLENNAANRTTAFNPLLPPAATNSFNESPQNFRQPARELPPELNAGVPAAPKPATPNPKAKSRTASRQGWESWA